MSGESSYGERAPTPAPTALASSVWIQQVGDRPVAQRHVPHGGADLAAKTVANNISAIFVKLRVADRKQAIVRARDAGLG